MNSIIQNCSACNSINVRHIEVSAGNFQPLPHYTPGGQVCSIHADRPAKGTDYYLSGSWKLIDQYDYEEEARLTQLLGTIGPSE